MDWIEKLYYKLNKEEEEFYIEDDRIVFTEIHHLKRGFCCKSGCRHCPYTNKKEHPDPS